MIYFYSVSFWLKQNKKVATKISFSVTLTSIFQMSIEYSDSIQLNMDDRKRNSGGFRTFFNEYKALLKKMFLLTKRKRTQTIFEFLLAYIFLALFLIMRYLLTRPYSPPFQIEPFYPHQSMESNTTTANITYFYPSDDLSLCTFRFTSIFSILR